MLKKWLAKSGVGGLKVDTKLDQDILYPGERVTGTIELVGGKVEQQINGIDLIFMIEYFVKNVDTTNPGKTTRVREEINRVSIPASFSIQPEERRVMDLDIVVPLDLPPSIDDLTSDDINMWIKTNVDVPGAVDSKDKDDITVGQHPYVQKVLDIMVSELNFHLKSASLTKSLKTNFNFQMRGLTPPSLDGIRF